MADSDRTIRVRFDGSVAGLVAASRQAESALDRFGASAKVVTLATVAAGAGAAAMGAAVPLLGSVALGFGVAAAAMSGTKEALDAYGEAMASGNGDLTEYNKLLAKMSPAQREFTKQLVAMREPLSKLQDIAAESFLPGVTALLKDSQGLFPVFARNIERTGKIMSDTARDLGSLFSSERFKTNLDGFLRATEPITKQLGDSIVRITDKVVEFGSKMSPAAEGFATFIDDVTIGFEGFLDSLTPYAEDFKVLWEGLGEVVKELLPIIGELAGKAAEILGPALKDLAGFIRENKDAIVEWVPVIGAVVLGLKALNMVSAVVGWAKGIAGAFGLIGGAAEREGGRLGSRGGGGLLGKLGAIGLAAGAAYLALDSLSKIKIEIPEPDSSGLDHFSTEAQTTWKQIGDMFDSVMSGEFGNLAKQWDNFWGGNRTNIKLGIDDKAAWATAEAFITGINATGATVNVDGNTLPLGDAVTTVMDAIALGHSTVTIDGDTIPVDDAMNDLRERINREKGNITINGNTVPAGDALFSVLEKIQGASGTLTINGDQTPVSESLSEVQDAINKGEGTVTINGDTFSAKFAKDLLIKSINQSAAAIKIDGNTVPAGDALVLLEDLIAKGGGFVKIDGKTLPAEKALELVKGRIDTTTGSLTLDGNPAPVYQKMGEATAAAGTMTGVITLDGNADPALGRINGTVELANGSKGIITLDGNGAPAEIKLGDTKYKIDTTTGVLTIDGNPGPADTDLSGAKVRIDKTTGTITIEGDPAKANQKTSDAKTTADRTTGTMTVNADDGPARGVIQSLRDWASSAVSFFVHAVTGLAAGGVVAPMATGGIMGFADGAAAQMRGLGLTPMSNDFARIVPPNTWRVIGDRQHGDEFFIPDNNHPRSIAIGKEWARRRGFALVPRKYVGMASGGLLAQQSINVQLPTQAGGTPTTNVSVYLDGEAIRAITRTEIRRSERDVRRTVGAGAGVSF